MEPGSQLTSVLNENKLQVSKKAQIHAEKTKKNKKERIEKGKNHTHTQTNKNRESNAIQ